MGYTKEIIDEYVLGQAVLVVFDDHSVESGYFLESASLPERMRWGIHKSSKYCILPFNTRCGAHFFPLKCVEEIVFVFNRYMVAKNQRELNRRMKEPVKTNCIGEVINNVMPHDKFKMLWDESLRY